MLSPDVNNSFRTSVDDFPRGLNGPGIVSVTEVPTHRQASQINVFATAAEVRIDYFPSVSHQTDLEKTLEMLAPTPLLGTLRSVQQGGKSTANTPLRNKIIRSLFTRFDAIDLEIGTHSVASLTEAAHDEGCAVVASYHDMQSTPSVAHMERLLEDALERGADYVKFATTTSTQEELDTLAEFTRNNKTEPIITVSMGTMGETGRIMLLGLGSRATFVYVGDNPVVPGQLSLHKLAMG